MSAEAIDRAALAETWCAQTGCSTGATNAWHALYRLLAEGSS